MGRIRDAIDDGQAWLEERLLAAANPIFYRMRRVIAFQRKGYRENPDLGIAPAPSLAAWMTGAAAAEAVSRYGLERFRARLSAAAFAATCRMTWMLHELGRAPDAALPAVGVGVGTRALDVGAKNFEHAVAIHSFLAERSGDPVGPEVTGIEVDAHRVYRGLHSRYDAAVYYLSLLPGGSSRHRFLAGDFLEHRERYDVILWSKPFLHPYPLLRWGLPARMLRPEEMVRHMLTLLAPGGWCVILNQSEAEDAAQRELLHHCQARFTSRVVHDPAGGAGGRAFAHVIRSSAVEDHEVAPDDRPL